MRPGTAPERHHSVVRDLARRHVHLTVEGAIGSEHDVSAVSAVRHGHRTVPPDVDVVGAAELSGALASPAQGSDESAITVQNGHDRDIGVQDEQVAAAIEPHARRCPELSPIGRVHVTHPEHLDELHSQGPIGVQGVIRYVGAGTRRNCQREGLQGCSSAHGVILVSVKGPTQGSKTLNSK